MISRRKFIRNAAGLLVPSTALGSVPLPLGFWKPSSSSSAVTCDDATAIILRDDWVSRVQGQGSDVTIAGTQLAVCAFIAGLIADGVWSKIGRISINAGDDLNALKAPLKNGGDVALVDNLSNFVSGDYSQSIGLTGNITTKSVGLGTTMAGAGASADDLHLACYCRTSDDVGIVMGTQNAGNGNADFLAPSQGGGTTVFESNNFTTGLATTSVGGDSGGVGMYVGSRTSSSSQVIYKNGVSIATNGGASGVLIGGRVSVHAMTSGGVGTFFTARTVEMHSVGVGLTATDAANLTARYATLRTALGR